ncbi:hypothetical protein IQ25_00876 [Novosphingobium taihuense]|uniref:Uncharacterized protein n=1 Tax=Novosphingobium taihuense TaxID=260085 RepID=A0A7W7A7K6_9SPHN|nr:hypothetical protein [Novosphingobium taihuense]TWH88752.1 hypothetical protein IQ25_00876 [Novosphingobium taihuense]
MIRNGRVMNPAVFVLAYPFVIASDRRERGNPEGFASALWIASSLRSSQ